MLYNKPITNFSNLVVSRVDYCVIDHFVLCDHRSFNCKLSNCEVAPGCIEQLKIKLEFLQLFATVPGVLQDFFRTNVVFPILFNPRSVDLTIMACKEIAQKIENG